MSAGFLSHLASGYVCTGSHIGWQALTSGTHEPASIIHEVRVPASLASNQAVSMDTVADPSVGAARTSGRFWSIETFIASTVGVATGNCVTLNRKMRARITLRPLSLRRRLKLDFCTASIGDLCEKFHPHPTSESKSPVHDHTGVDDVHTPSPSTAHGRPVIQCQVLSGPPRALQ